MNAPKLTYDEIESVIKEVAYYQFPGTTVTICCITLTNGYNVIGESACISQLNFDAKLGKEIAKKSAVEKIWALEGYMLKQRLFCFQK